MDQDEKAVTLFVRYEVQRLEGYTDGKPSWRKHWVPRQRVAGRERAEATVKDLQARFPETKFRLRAERKKRGRR